MSGKVEYTERMSGTMESPEGCPGRKEDGKCQAAEKTDSASHMGGADAKGQCRAARAASVSHSASHVGGGQAVERTASQAVDGTASSSQVGGVNQWVS